MTDIERRRVTRTAKPAQEASSQRDAHRAAIHAPGKASVHDIALAVPNLPLATGLLAAALVIAGLYFGRDILIPLALAILLGFVLDPLVVRLRRARLPRIVAVIIVVGIALGAVAVTTYFLTIQVRQLSEQLPIYQSNIQNKVRLFRTRLAEPGMFDGAVRAIETVKKEVEEATPPPSPGRTAGVAAPAVPQPVKIVETPPSPLSKAGRWLSAVSGPLADAGIVLVFLFLVLLDRQDLRDRLLRLLGGNLHRTTDALDEAGARISKYLIMQLVVNASYGIPMAVGLWLIGVPGAVLWGALAAVMRFVPYVGPMISAVFPLALAFAVDPGWSLVLWTLGLIVLLELVSNNIVEPWLYGASTGLSAMSLIVSATFWAALWGPIGLMMSTPLTVCLLVVGRHLPHLKFFDVLLGSQAALDPPTRLYQRLLAGDTEEAIEIATERIEVDGVDAFYHQVAIPALRLASGDHGRVSTAEHRHRVVTGMSRMVEELVELYPPTAAAAGLRVLCIGGKWELDTIAARVLAHGLSLAGIPATHRAAENASSEFFANLDLRGAKVVCLSHFSPDPMTQMRYLCRRLRRRWPDLHIVLVAWNAPPELLAAGACETLGADAVAVSYEETLLRVSHHLDTALDVPFLPAPIPEDEVERVRALRASGAFNPAMRAQFDQASKRAADIFDVPIALVTLIDEENQCVGGRSEQVRAEMAAAPDPDSFNMPRALSMCGHVVASRQPMVVEDVARDPRFANNPALQAAGIRFYAGAPFGNADGHVFGSLCILDTRPRSLSERELRLLGTLADELINLVRAQARRIHPPTPPASRCPNRPTTTCRSSATIAQPVPI